MRLHTAQDIIGLLRIHCTALLTDKEFTKFIDEYTANKSRKNRSRLVSALVVLFCSRTNDSISTKRFKTGVNALLGTYNNLVNGRKVTHEVTVRTSKTHPSEDWLCVGDSRHWDSCLRTGYQRTRANKLKEGKFLQPASLEDFEDWLTNERNIENLDGSGCNARYAVIEQNNYENVVLLTTGKPVYEDGEGYISRVRLHEGKVKITKDGVSVSRPCLMWDRFYGSDSLLVPTWEAAIAYAESIGVLLVKSRFVEGQVYHTTARMRNSKPYTDEMGGDCNVAVIHDIHDALNNRKRNTYKMLRDKRNELVRPDGTSLRSYKVVNCDTLMTECLVFPWVTRNDTQQPDNIKQVSSTYYMEGPEHAPYYFTRKIRMVPRSKLSVMVMNTVIEHYGLPAETYRDGTNERFYFESAPVGVSFKCITVEGYNMDLPELPFFHYYCCYHTTIRTGPKSTTTHIVNQQGEFMTISVDRTHSLLTLDERYNTIRYYIYALECMPLSLVPYPKFIPGTQSRNISDKRNPKEQLDYLTKTLLARYSKVYKLPVDHKQHRDFLGITMPYVIDLLMTFDHQSWE